MPKIGLMSKFNEVISDHPVEVLFGRNGSGDLCRGLIA